MLIKKIMFNDLVCYYFKLPQNHPSTENNNTLMRIVTGLYLFKVFQGTSHRFTVYDTVIELAVIIIIHTNINNAVVSVQLFVNRSCKNDWTDWVDFWHGDGYNRSGQLKHAYDSSFNI